MEKKYQKSGVAKILIILTSIVVIPFISPSFRSTYLLNLLIILLALDSGILFESFSDTTTTTTSTTGAAKPPATVVVLLPISTSTPLTTDPTSTTTDSDMTAYPPVPLTDEQMKDVQVEMKSKSRFFVSTVTDEEESDDGTTVDEDSDVGSQELFVKAETFIGNFYRQLRTEREDPPWFLPEEDTY